MKSSFLFIYIVSGLAGSITWKSPKLEQQPLNHPKPSQAISINPVFMSCLYAAASALVVGLDGW